MENPENQDLPEPEPSEIVPVIVDPRDRVYTTRELGLRVFASRCSVLFDSYLNLLNTFDQKRIAQAIFGMEGTYEEIVAHEKYLIEQYLQRPIRERNSIGPFFAPEAMPGFKVWQCNGHVYYLPEGYKIVKDDGITDNVDTAAVIDAREVSEVPPPFLSTPGSLPTCPKTSQLITASRNIYDASDMVMNKLEKMFINNEQRSCSDGNGKMRAKCNTLEEHNAQKVLDSVQDSLFTLLQKIDVIDYYIEGGEVPETRDSWLPHTVAKDLARYLQNVQNMHVEPPAPEVRQRMIVYNEIVAPMYPPNPVATQDSSYGSIPDVTLPFQDLFDLDVAWQMQERPLPQFPYVSNSPSESLSGQPQSTPMEVQQKTTGEEEKADDEKEESGGDDDEKEESEGDELSAGELESKLVNERHTKVSDWLQMSEKHSQQPPEGSKGKKKKNRNNRQKRQAKKRAQQDNAQVANVQDPSTAGPSTSK